MSLSSKLDDGDNDDENDGQCSGGVYPACFISLPFNAWLV